MVEEGVEVGVAEGDTIPGGEEEVMRDEVLPMDKTSKTIRPVLPRIVIWSLKKVDRCIGS